MIKRTFLSGALALLCLTATAQTLTDWRTVPIDAHRTGVCIPTADNVPTAIGKVSKGVYTAPDGLRFKGSTARVAELMIQAQPQMAVVKEVVCQCAAPMSAHRPQSELSNLIVDRLMVKAGELTGKRIDVGISNFGGIRADFSEGEIILDDVISMLPFKNFVTYVQLPGSELRRIFERMASLRPEVVGGVQLRFKDGRLTQALIQGKPLQDNALYGVASIDFLLDGGDGINLARNAKSVIVTECLMRDSLLPYLRELAARGEALSYHIDDRIIIED